VRCRRCLEAWQGRVLRRQQLEGLLLQGLAMSEQMAAKSAFRGWHEVRHWQYDASGTWQSEQAFVVRRNAAGL
jgi:hypothetical protein